MNISISDHFTFKKIFRFTISPILMMIFTSLYGIVDGFFISNYSGADAASSYAAYAGVNLIMPVVMIIGGMGFMFGTGGSALASMCLGMQDRKRANAVFSMIIKTIVIVGIVISILGVIFVSPIAEAFGRLTNNSTQEMIEEAVKYGRVICAGQVFFMLQNAFQSFLVVDEKPKLGFIFTLISGCSNMFLDFLFIAVFKWGVIGAGVATIMGYAIGTTCPLIHFLKNKNGNINLVNAKIKLKEVGQACFNGSSEFVSNISSSIVGLVFNIQLLRYYGQNGVAAYGTLMYVSFIFVATYVGYAIGMAPIAGYNYGAKNTKELNNVLTKSLIIIASLALIMFCASEFIGPLFAKLYIGKDEELLSLTKLAFRIFSIQFIFCGFSIYLSSFFTALNNGLISALISFIRTLILEVSMVFILPAIFGASGIWWSIAVTEMLACILSFIFLITQNRKYNYFNFQSKN